MEYVNAYGDFIIREVMAGAAPKVICLSIGLCDTSKLHDISDVRISSVIGLD